MKIIIRAAVAMAAATGLMLTVAPAAFASAPASGASARDFDDSFDQESRNGLATVEAEYSVEGDDEDENTFVLRGGLYDGDRRSLAQGGRCAYFEVQTVSSDDDWNVAKRVKQCGYRATKYFRVTAHDVSEVRVKTCQISYRGWSTNKCSRWYELDLGF